MARFIHFITKDSSNKRYALIALISIAVQIIIFKILYPYADFFSDSYFYIYAARENLNISIWPIGYSWFLSIFHWFTHSDTAVVCFQYLIIELSALYLFFSVLYIYKPANILKNMLFIFLIYNPVLLYLSNYINSDAIFLFLSILWFTEMLWSIHNGSMARVLSQSVFVFLAFIVRNNAYYYPIVGAIAFITSTQKIKIKLAGILLPLLLIVPFILYTRKAAKELTGTAQYSLFTGWQLANNSLYMYNHIQIDSNLFSSKECRELNRISSSFYKGVDAGFSDYLSGYTANFFIRERTAPLKQYYLRHYKPKNELEDIQDWGKASVVFSEFGSTLIKHHPVSFARHFMLLNTRNYFLPPLEKLEIYNLGANDVWPIAQEWFNYKSSKISAVSKTLQGSILTFYPSAFFVLNLYSIYCLLLLVARRRKIIVSSTYKETVYTGYALLICNLLFCVFSTIIVFRYQIFPMIICALVSVLATDKLFTMPSEGDLVGKKILSNI